MKALIIYALTWFTVLAGAGLVYLTGNFNETTLTIFGFISATLFFAGLVMMLPVLVDEHYSWKY